MSVEDDEKDKKRRQVEMRMKDRRIFVMMSVMEWSGVERRVDVEVKERMSDIVFEGNRDLAGNTSWI